MPNLNIAKPELVWPGKYDDDGNLIENRGAALPFQVIETIKEGRATRQSGQLADLFTYTASQNEEENWHNKLIWGDNLLAMASLLKDFAGKIDLIYIDPPFATGADFSVTAQIGETGESIDKEQSVIEKKAYRDTSGGGLQTFLQMLFCRFATVRELLSSQGAIYGHIGWQVSHYVKLLLDEVLGQTGFLNQIIWKRQTAHSDIAQGSNELGTVHDSGTWGIGR